MAGDKGFDAAALTATFPASIPSVGDFLVQTNNDPKDLTFSIPLSTAGPYPVYFEVAGSIPSGEIPQFGVCTIDDERIKFEFNDAGFPAGGNKRFRINAVGSRGFDGSFEGITGHDANLPTPPKVYFNVVAWHHNKLVSELRAVMVKVDDVADAVDAGASYTLNTVAGQLGGGGTFTPSTPTLTIGLDSIAGNGIPAVNLNAPKIDVDEFGRVTKVVVLADPVRDGDAAYGTGSDLGNFYPDPIVTGLLGSPLGLQPATVDSTTLPTTVAAGDVLKRNATNDGWVWASAASLGPQLTTNNYWTGKNTFKDGTNFQILETTDPPVPPGTTAPNSTTRRLQFDIEATGVHAVPSGKIATIRVEHQADRTYTITDSGSADMLPVFQRRTVVTGTPSSTNQVIKWVSTDAPSSTDTAAWGTAPSTGAPANASYITFDNASTANDDLTNNRVLSFGNGIKFTPVSNVDNGLLPISIQETDSLRWTGTEEFIDGWATANGFRIFSETAPQTGAIVFKAPVEANRKARLRFGDTLLDHTYIFPDMGMLTAGPNIVLGFDPLYITNTPTGVGDVLTSMASANNGSGNFISRAQWAPASGGITLGGNNTWTGTNTFWDGTFFQILDRNAPHTKTLEFDVQGAAAAAIATLAFAHQADRTYRVTDHATALFIPLFTGAMAVTNAAANGQVLTATGVNTSTWQTLSGVSTSGANTWTGANTFFDSNPNSTIGLIVVNQTDQTKKVKWALDQMATGKTVFIRPSDSVDRDYMLAQATVTDPVLYIPVAKSFLYISNIIAGPGLVLTSVGAGEASWQSPATGASSGGWTWVLTSSASNTLAGGSSYVATGNVTQTFTLPLGVPVGTTVQIAYRGNPTGGLTAGKIKIVPGLSAGMKIIFGSQLTTAVAGYVQSGANGTSSLGSVTEISCVDSTSGSELWMVMDSTGFYDVV